MREVINLLKGSDTPDVDITTFVRANIIFWLLGATDGHAKNFSVFITPGGRFRMTPAYDVLTAQPSLDAGQIPRKKFKLAMSVGKNRHYDVHENHAAALPPDGRPRRGRPSRNALHRRGPGASRPAKGCGGD
jgi:serine/threonine-protein kinase HipA